jgi:hypothetical protein
VPTTIDFPRETEHAVKKKLKKSLKKRLRKLVGKHGQEVALSLVTDFIGGVAPTHAPKRGRMRKLLLRRRA